MASQYRQFITLDSCINDYITESEQSNHKYYKHFHLAFRGMEQLGIDFFYQIKSVKLPVLSNKTVPLPPDYQNYQKVGVLNGGGEVISLRYNSKLTTYADLQTERISKTVDNTLFDLYIANTPIFYNYWNGEVFINLYGIPSGSPTVGGFKIDDSNGVILLDENFGYDYIILEYIASPVEGQDYFIPMQFREALIAWLGWKDIANLPTTRRGNLGDKRDRRHDFFNERRLANARYRPLYLEQAYELNLEMTRMAVKA